MKVALTQLSTEQIRSSVRTPAVLLFCDTNTMRHNEDCALTLQVRDQLVVGTATASPRHDEGCYRFRNRLWKRIRMLPLDASSHFMPSAKWMMMMMLKENPVARFCVTCVTVLKTRRNST